MTVLLRDTDLPIGRSTLARIGVTALNLPAPGLGLLRTGNLRLGLGWLLVLPVTIAALVLAAALSPTPDVDAYLAISATLLVAAFAGLIVVLALTWRRSRTTAPLHWWNRWYALIAIYLVSAVVSALMVDAIHGIYKPFYAPAASMVPTILVGDNFLVDMRDDGPPRRGEIVIFDTPRGQWIKRVVAVGGDRIAVRGGVPIINGRSAMRQAAGRRSEMMGTETISGEIFEERLPGVRVTYRVLDLGPMTFDDMATITVPPGHFFAMGDSRDNSLDSRYSVEQGGVGMIANARVVGRPLFIYWRDGRIMRGGKVNPSMGLEPAPSTR